MRSRVNSLIGAALLATLLSSCGVRKALHHMPDLSGYNDSIPQVQLLDSAGDVRRCGTGTLLRNDHGLWELRLQGDPLELGLYQGALEGDLYRHQENIFFDKIKDLVPKPGKQRLLIKFLGWFNRNMYKHVTNEYLAEIEGLSRYDGHTYDHVAPAYMRALYLHGAHDIGHAVQQMALVECSSFAAWGESSCDGELIIGRNFDFYAGDAFAENRVVSFIAPALGHRFMSVSWPGFIGVLSGMNDQGLTVTMNSGRSSVPLQAKTPISILALEIMQYASTIDEAVAIAKKRDVFVSESLMIGSAKDGRAVVIEKSPRKMDVFQVPGADHLVCTNHFQGEAYAKDRRNRQQIAESHSMYRFERLEELIARTPCMDPPAAAAILRERKGLKDAPLGNGNELAINQLMAHHSIIFKPESRQVWISTPPYQLGDYIAYDLDEVFNDMKATDTVKSFMIDSLAIPADPFEHTKEFADYEQFRLKRTELEKAHHSGDEMPDPDAIVPLNPGSWEAHYLAGAYHYAHREYNKAEEQLEQALKLPIPYTHKREQIGKLLHKSRKKAKH
ncbi:MAG: acyl-CoA--6-aminopenicillanic acid acyl-transferase [Flavobacteriales bacterium]|nr:acyl-CoA--6-aminopenicillanic acid acyl-transferase [Flavobacteriales bacterium]MBK6893088.1 acyl-CoA--6-aminopenicillanic acid acyl-transferase [Flavobacteriales bacterium]MBK7249192.1 acyl-CoA--6-aminopenicillanic acid acyl-transferase [Flavobacteriales bacterium]MBK7285749.1 acyl-CoA--6-aminopenicillanic acid acyl-transferase [Flavobacteriales bacterium]MBK9058573.1 acyl-CoA--6-aminopenicillanic acid acyl-transferase [Flavobacteriales bacterium]